MHPPALLWADRLRERERERERMHMLGQGMSRGPILLLGGVRRGGVKVGKVLESGLGQIKKEGRPDVAHRLQFEDPWNRLMLCCFACAFLE